MKRTLFVLAPATALAASLYLVDLPLFVVAPGPARDVVPLIEVTGPRTFPSSSRLLLTTVTVGRVNVFETIEAWLDPAAEVFAERLLVPRGQTDEEYAQVSLSQMDESKIAAVSVALERLTDYPKDHGAGALIQDVIEGTPAEGLLFPGDLVTSADRREVRSVDQLARRIQRVGTGREIRLVVEAGGETRDVSIRPAVVPDGDRPVIGVVLVENFPFDVLIDSGSIGGPSAGLMWALGLYDLLTPGDLFEGRSVAGTGVIGLDGSVSPIGGIEQKILAAERAGADAFLVPHDNLTAARTVAGGIDLIPVRTFDALIRGLEAET